MDVRPRRARDRRQTRVRLDRRVLLEQRKRVCGLSLVLHRLKTILVRSPTTTSHTTSSSPSRSVGRRARVSSSRLEASDH